MQEGDPFKKTKMALTLLTVYFCIALAGAAFSILTNILYLLGIIDNTSIISPTGKVDNGMFGILLLVGGVACLILLAQVAFIVIIGAFMLMSKKETQELHVMAMPAGIMMIIAGPLLFIPCLNIFQPVLFLISLIIFIRKIGKPIHALLIYIGAGGLVLAFFIGIASAILTLATMNTQIGFILSIVVGLIDITCYSLFLAAVIGTKGNSSAWHKQISFSQFPPGYPPQGGYYAPAGGFQQYPPPPGRGYMGQYGPPYR